MENTYPHTSGYIGFTNPARGLRAIYSFEDAMPVELVSAGEPSTYKLYNRWPGENKWISFSNDGTWLYARYEEESDAMTIKFVATHVPNTYKMLNMTRGWENQWISFTDDGSWLRAVYNESDAMPVRLSFRPFLSDPPEN